MRTRLLSILLAVIAFAVCTVLAVVIIRGLDARSRLESQNDCERTINVLLSSLRNYEDFGAAIEGTTLLQRKIVGVSVFDRAETLLYAWGEAQRTYPTEKFTGAEETGQMLEMYIEKARNDSMIVLMKPLRPPEKPPEKQRDNEDNPRVSTFMQDTFRKADLIYLEIRQPAYWREMRVHAVLLPVVELFLALLIAFMWFLIIKNAEYRANAERQKNLVMLGTAASTLAHEIKNPLLAIRLQTGILSRSLSGDTGHRELSIIDDEVERLTMLSTRVNDILRDPTGQPVTLDPLEIASEVGTRLCGRAVAVFTGNGRPEARRVSIDPERLRSIVENLLRNALESGGRDDEVAIEVAVNGGQVHCDVLDRGTGIPLKSKEQAFDPFFTTKSRGTGIGLAICRRFARAARGEVTLEDRPGGGTRARVSLPRVET